MYLFNNYKHTSYVELRSIVTNFAKLRGARGVSFNRNANRVLGTYNSNNKQIFLSLKQPKKQFLCTFFHELAHHTAVKQKKWMSYHFNKAVFSERQIYDIENNVDQIAQKLWNEFVNKKVWGNYIYAYPKKRQPKC